MKSRFLTLFLVIILLVFGIFTTKSFAVSSNDILVDVVPSNPTPLGDVTINLSSYVANLDSVLITWSQNGKTVSSGIGKKTFSLKAGAAGTSLVVTATISLPDGAITTRIVVRPSVMVLLWQANDSYVPPFYRGKAMPTPESEIKVVAMPEVKSGSSIVNPNNMTYAWQQDYTNNVDGSGYGKNSFTYIGDYLDDTNNISVTATTIDQNNYSSQASIDIGTTTPKILFYKNDDNLGTIWENTLKDGHKITDSETVTAAPYFISPKELVTPTLVWNWFLNDSPIDVPGFVKNFMPLKVQAGVSGTSTVRLEIRNQQKIFETVSNQMNVQF